MGGVFGRKTRTSTAAEQLDNMCVSTSGYGRCIPVAYGKVRVAANLIFYDDFRAIPHTETTRSGKGGGGSTHTNTTYTYRAAVILAICEGPISVGVAWVDKDIYPGPASIGLTVMNGNQSQSPWPYAISKGKGVGYGSTAYVAHSAIDLGTSGSTKNHSFEITGFCSGANIPGDANAADVIFDMLTNTVHGMGFPPEAIDSLTDYRAYTAAAGLYLSGCYFDQRPGLEILKNLLACTNSISVWSGGKLKIVPLGDLPIGDWQPNSTPLYALTVDDFLGQDDPVQVKRKTSADAYNSVKIKFNNRNIAYAEDIAAADDLATQDLFGVRPAPDFGADCIASEGVAQVLAQTMLQRYVGIRNEYKFKLGWRHTFLEPGDLVTLTEPGLGLNNTPVRIVSVEEDAEGELTVTAEDWPNGIATAVAYPVPLREGEGPNAATPPGNCNPPVIFEPPPDLTGGELQAWIGTSGGDNWGGCEIWASRDNATYSLAGRIDAPARHGSLTSTLPAFNAINPDNGNTLAVNLSISKGELISASQLDADHWETLCYVDGEILSFRYASLTGANRYNLTSLRRGLFGTIAGAHASDTKFMRLDDAVAQIDFARWDIAAGGETIYLKFPSFNKFGQAIQGLDEVAAVPFLLKGTSFRQLTPPSGCIIAVTTSRPY
ncbi:MAG: phage tail protein [Holophagaceae bacterium]|nr:phage tail protein [Holophagaceae bacterium]